MKDRIKMLMVSLGAVFAVAAPAAVVGAQSTSVTQQNVGCGIELQQTDCTTAVQTSDGESKIVGIIKTVINVLSMIVGAICIIMIVFGGFRYMTSGGESAGVSGAKNTILYAVVGLVVVLLAQAIVRFVFSRTTAPTTP